MNEHNEFVEQSSLHGIDIMDREEEPREEMVYEEDDGTEESFDGGVDVANFGNCNSAEELDPKL
jgi:hypothetical protein